MMLIFCTLYTLLTIEQLENHVFLESVKLSYKSRQARERETTQFVVVHINARHQLLSAFEPARDINLSSGNLTPQGYSGYVG